MTVGALIQLQYGNTDRMAFLTLNPQITHFKSVYKKYTNFSTQFINVQPKLTDGILPFTTKYTKITFSLPRDGDAIRDIYFTFELPDIYSNSNYQFQWIKRIGEYIVHSVSLQIDTNQAIDTHYGEWFHASSELGLDDGKKAGYYRMIGHIPELYDPANAPGNNGIYPNHASIGAPSIINRKIYLPLSFWFNKISSMAFPLIAIQKTVMNLVFNLRPMQELYTVIDYGFTGKRVKPNRASHYIGNFLLPITGNSSLYINPRLEINNIFLDTEERKRFALTTHEYLITQVQRIEQSYNTNTQVIVDLKNINKPITQLVFMIRRSDMENVNDWSNYTNWNVSPIPPYSNGYLNPYGDPLSINNNNIIYYKNENILKGAVLRLMANEITMGNYRNNDNPTGSQLTGKDFIFYNLVQNYNANRNMPAEGIYSYSFSLDNTSLQPIGAVNFSSIDNKDILLDLIPINPSEIMNPLYGNSTSYTYNYIINVFAVNYDILKIMGGLVNTMTAN
jgi:hypothetical protein